jgi:chromosome partitioning protein
MKGERTMTRIIAIANQKGGIGKTTSPANLAAALAIKGKRSLLVDMDPQATLTAALGIQGASQTIYDVLTGPATIQDTVISRPGFDLIPASSRLVGIELELAGTPGREYVLKEKLAPMVASYDFILIDCPPGLGLLTQNSLTAAGEIFIPLQAEYLSLDGMARLLATVELVKNRLNPQLVIAGVIVTRFGSRHKLNRVVMEAIRARFPGVLFSQPIRENIALVEAPSYGAHIFDYQADNSDAADYLALADEILAKAY